MLLFIINIMYEVELYKEVVNIFDASGFTDNLFGQSSIASDSKVKYI